MAMATSLERILPRLWAQSRFWASVYFEGRLQTSDLDHSGLLPLADRFDQFTPDKQSHRQSLSLHGHLENHRHRRLITELYASDVGAGRTVGHVGLPIQLPLLRDRPQFLP
jgi:hypothetical protein